MLSPEMVPESQKPRRGRRHVTELFVAPNGNMKWTGTLPEPNARRSDGPLPSLHEARNRLRNTPTPGPVTVWIRGGTYALREPLTFTAEDAAPVTYAAFEDEEVVISGGGRVTGWETGEINGAAAWTADVSAALARGCRFRQLFVNGQRRPRSRLPREGCYDMAHVPGIDFGRFMGGEPTDFFFSGGDDIRPWRNLQDVDVVAVHFWNEERMPIVSFDPQTRRVQCAARSVWPLKDDAAPRFARYWVENVREAVTEPGQWYFDRAENRLYYLPLSGETPENTDVIAPCLSQLLVLRGEEDRPVTQLTFEGLQLRHTVWELPDSARAGYEQASLNVPAAVHLQHARHCTLRRCRVSQIGGYGIELGPGCVADRVQHCTVQDMGAGGVKCIGTALDGPPRRRTCHNVIADNTIADGGKVFHSAVGILVVHAAGNDIVHNHIHHLEYSGISCGWTWGYGPNATRDNLIAHNHIHHLGTGLLNDMGGIYTLGEQPGTVLRGNLIHDIRMHNYGGWAIYADEGSSYLVIEHNVCYATDSESFQLHFGRENILRHNIFALSKQGLVSLNVVDETLNAFTLIHNIMLTDGQPVLMARHRETLSVGGLTSDANVFWDINGAPVFAADRQVDAQSNKVTTRKLDVEDLRRLGYDRHSRVCDPGFRAPREGDFSLPEDSPALAVGFVPLDMSGAGPRREA
jgi:hypothetical protein